MAVYDLDASIFSANITKLEDLMVPLSAFNKQVETIEGLKGYEISITRETDHTRKDITDEAYVLPYPYNSPVYEYAYTMAQKHPISSLDSQVYNKWKAMIDARTVSFAKFSLDMPTIKRLDMDQDISIIVHMLTGLIQVVHHKQLKNFSVVTMPNNFFLYNMLFKELHNMLVTGDQKAYMMFRAGEMKIASDDKYRMIYAISEEDPRSKEVVHGYTIPTMTDRLCVSLPDAMSIGNDLVRRVYNKEKLIINA